ncbi:uncharacterized protein [Littorina saxatilis]|uniref:uncharacterized protein isoform X2 n=1 Tax=Littorina saxatilis TaxID=31220 RepID=UPI0038B5C6DF
MTLEKMNVVLLLTAILVALSLVASQSNNDDQPTTQEPVKAHGSIPGAVLSSVGMANDTDTVGGAEAPGNNNNDVAENSALNIANDTKTVGEAADATGNTNDVAKKSDEKPKRATNFHMPMGP